MIDINKQLFITKQLVFAQSLSRKTPSALVIANITNLANNLYDAIPLKAKLDGTSFSGFTQITVGTIAPANPQVNDLWVDLN